jgi:hypothetical protein
MQQLPEGAPKIVRGRKNYDCSTGCGRPIARDELQVTVHDSAPQRGRMGKALTHLRANHFAVRYHIVCFARTGGGNDQRTGMLSYDVRELEGYDRHRDEVEQLLREAGL